MSISYYLFCGVVVMGLAAMIYALEWRCYFEIWTILLPLAPFLNSRSNQGEQRQIRHWGRFAMWQ